MEKRIIFKNPNGSTYNAQIRNVTGAGRLSLWAPETPVSIEAVLDNTSYFTVVKAAL